MHQFANRREDNTNMKYGGRLTDSDSKFEDPSRSILSFVLICE